jgi:hypothetical protein
MKVKNPALQNKKYGPRKGGAAPSTVLLFRVRVAAKLLLGASSMQKLWTMDESQMTRPVYSLIQTPTQMWLAPQNQNKNVTGGDGWFQNSALRPFQLCNYQGSSLSRNASLAVGTRFVVRWFVA